MCVTNTSNDMLALHHAKFHCPCPQIDAGLVQYGSSDAAFPLVLLCVVLVAVGDGLAQPTVFADAALLPDKYTQVRYMAICGNSWHSWLVQSYTHDQ